MARRTDAMLIVEKGIPEASVIPLEGPRCVLGKSAGADVVLDNPYVSRQHAQVFEDGDQFRIKDLGSKNGTFLNGIPVGEKGATLRSGDRIELAQGQVVLKFQEGRSTMTLPLPAAASRGDLLVDSKSREVWLKGNRVDPRLARKEFDVLDLLYERRGEACSKDEIAAHGWPERNEGDVADQDIEQCIRRLRLRLEADPSKPSYINTIRGYGYKLSLG